MDQKSYCYLSLASDFYDIIDQKELESLCTGETTGFERRVCLSIARDSAAEWHRAATPEDVLVCKGVYVKHKWTVAPPDMYYGNTVIRTGSTEVLNGTVNGMDASDIEERFARAIAKLELPFEFRIRLSSDALGMRHLTAEFANIRGEIEIDFLIDRGQVWPIFIDGEIAHFFTPAQAEEDHIKTNAVNEYGRYFGWKEAIRVPFWKLIDQDTADRTARDIFI